MEEGRDGKLLLDASQQAILGTTPSPEHCLWYSNSSCLWIGTKLLYNSFFGVLTSSCTHAYVTTQLRVYDEGEGGMEGGMEGTRNGGREG